MQCVVTGLLVQGAQQFVEVPRRDQRHALGQLAIPALGCWQGKGP